MADTAIADFLKAEGFVSPVSAAAARTVLEAAGLTRPGKARMVDEKRDRARDALTLAVVRHCSDPACVTAAAQDGRRLLETDKPHCAICSGSNNTRALRRMAA